MDQLEDLTGRISSSLTFGVESASVVEDTRHDSGPSSAEETEATLEKDMTDLNLDGDTAPPMSYRDALLRKVSDCTDDVQREGVEPERKKTRTWNPPKIVVKQVKKENEFGPRESIDVFEGAEDDGMNDFLFRQIFLDKMSHVLVRARSNLSVKQKAQKEKRILAK